MTQVRANGRIPQFLRARMAYTRSGSLVKRRSLIEFIGMQDMSLVEIRQNILKPEKIYNELKYGTMTQHHALRHHEKIPFFLTWNFPLFRPKKPAI